jgi:hypothetical protein
MQDPEQVDWNSAEGKQATERLNNFIRNIDKSVPEGHVRKFIPLGIDETGEPLWMIVWGKP